MKYLFFLLTLSLNFCWGQTRYSWDNIEHLDKGFEHKNYFKLNGSVKTIEINFIIEGKFSTLGIPYMGANKLKFNKRGYLTHKYDEYDNHLSEFYKYKNDSLLVYKKTQSYYMVRDFKKNLVSLSKDFHITEEKYTYNKYNKLLTKHIKSSLQKKYFINKNQIYNSDGLLIKSESLNNHIKIDRHNQCQGSGMLLRDFITYYKYNSSNELIKSESLVDESYWDKNRYQKIKKLSENYLKFFKPISNSEYFYNKNGFLIQKIKTDHQYEKLNLVKEFKQYDSKNRLVESFYEQNNGFLYGNFYEFHEENNRLTRKIKGVIHSEGSINTKLKYLYSIKDINLDGSFKYSIYHNNQIEVIEYYNKYQDLTQTTDRYNNILSEIKYTYDEKGNWTQKVVIEKGKTTEEITRKITYYQ